MSVQQPEPLRQDAESSPGLLLARLGRGAMDLYRSSLIGTGLKPPHVAALMQLQTEPVGQQALSEITGIDAVRLVGFLNDLETAGLIERRRDLVDRRRHIVAITCAGRARLDDVERLSAVAEERLLAGLTSTQREELGKLLRLVLTTSRMGEGCPGQNEPVASEGCDGSDEGDC